MGAQALRYSHFVRKIALLSSLVKGYLTAKGSALCTLAKGSKTLWNPKLGERGG